MEKMTLYSIFRVLLICEVVVFLLGGILVTNLDPIWMWEAVSWMPVLILITAVILAILRASLKADNRCANFV